MAEERKEAAKQGSPKAKAMAKAARAHCVPFFVWIGALLVVQMTHLTNVAEVHEGRSIVAGMGLFTMPAAYAVRAVLGALVLCLWRPWRYYEALKRKNVLPAVLLGVAVFLLWVGFETECVKKLLPGLSELYERWCVLPFGELRKPVEYVLLEAVDGVAPEVPDLAGQLYPVGEVVPDGYRAAALAGSVYSPAVCGWPLTLVRLAGSAFVIAVAEEFFWRGFLCRWIQNIDFLDVDIGKFAPFAFFVTVALFGAEHTEWLMGALTGVLYGLFFLRTRDIWAAAVAHVTTNLLLGVYVLVFGAYQFW